MKRPIHGCIGATSAALGTLILSLGVGQVMHPEHGRGVGAFLVGWGLLMWVPLFARPLQNLELASEALQRLRIAMLVCFGSSFIAYAMAALVGWGVIRVRDADAFIRTVLPVGVALFVVGLVLVFFVAYYDSQIGDASNDDDGG